MGLRNILINGDEQLRKHCRPVTDFGPKTAELMTDLAETMVKANGLGLAAPQVTYIAHALKEAGFPVRTDVITVAEAEEAILCTLAMDKEREN